MQKHYWLAALSDSDI